VVASATEIETADSAATAGLPRTRPVTDPSAPPEERPASEAQPPERPGLMGRARAFWREVQREMREWDWH